MDYQQLTNILTRLAGALIVVFAIVNIPVYFLSYYGLQIDSFSAFVGISIVPFILTIAIGVLLFLFPSIISNRLVSSSEKNNSINADNKLEAAGLSVLGAYLFVVGIADLVYLASLYTLAREITGSHFTPDRWADLTASVTELMFGLFLMLRSSDVVKYIHRK